MSSSDNRSEDNSVRNYRATNRNQRYCKAGPLIRENISETHSSGPKYREPVFPPEAGGPYRDDWSNWTDWTDEQWVDEGTQFHQPNTSHWGWYSPTKEPPYSDENLAKGLEETRSTEPSDHGNESEAESTRGERDDTPADHVSGSDSESGTSDDSEKHPGTHNLGAAKINEILGEDMEEGSVIAEYSEVTNYCPVEENLTRKVPEEIFKKVATGLLSGVPDLNLEFMDSDQNPPAIIINKDTRENDVSRHPPPKQGGKSFSPRNTKTNGNQNADKGVTKDQNPHCGRNATPPVRNQEGRTETKCQRKEDKSEDEPTNTTKSDGPSGKRRRKLKVKVTGTFELEFLEDED